MQQQNKLDQVIINDRVELTAQRGIDLLNKAKGNPLEKEIADYVMGVSVVLHNLLNNKV